MYQLLEKRKSRFQPYVYNNFLFTGTKEQLFITETNNISNINTLDIPNCMPGFSSWHNLVFLWITPQYPKPEFTLKLDLANYLVYQMPLENFLVISNIENGRLLFMNYENNIEYIGGYDINSSSILWQTENKNRFTLLLSNEKFFSRDTIESSFYCESILSGERFWTFDLKSLPKYVHYEGDKTEEITKVIGVFNKLVWLSTKGNCIISLDIESGDLRNFIEWKVDENTVSPDAHSALLHYEKGEIHILNTDYYTIISAETGKVILNVKQIEFSNELPLYRRFFTRLYGDLMCFSCHLKSTGKDFIGIFNIANQKLEWIYEMQLEFIKGKGMAFLPPSSIPQISNNKLFIMDSEGVIYIFEKEV